MSNELTIINKQTVDITKPKQFEQQVLQVVEAQKILKGFWGSVQEQMLNGNINELIGAFGKINFSTAQLLVINDPKVLDPAMTKLALDTKKVHGYVEVFGELPAGVGTNTITKFNKAK